MTSRILGQFGIWPIDTLFVLLRNWHPIFNNVLLTFWFWASWLCLIFRVGWHEKFEKVFSCEKRQKETIVRSTHVLPVMNCPCWPRNNHQTCSIFAPIDESVVVVSATSITKLKPLKKPCLHKTTSDQTTSRSTEYKIMTLDHFSAFLLLWICFWKSFLVSSRGINVVISSINVLASSILQVACIEEKPQTV